MTSQSVMTGRPSPWFPFGGAWPAIDRNPWPRAFVTDKLWYESAIGDRARRRGADGLMRVWVHHDVTRICDALGVPCTPALVAVYGDWATNPTRDATWTLVHVIDTTLALLR